MAEIWPLGAARVQVWPEKPARETDEKRQSPRRRDAMNEVRLGEQEANEPVATFGRQTRSATGR
jgi:hypothetical protein